MIKCQKILLSLVILLAIGLSACQKEQGAVPSTQTNSGNASSVIENTSAFKKNPSDPNNTTDFDSNISEDESILGGGDSDRDGDKVQTDQKDNSILGGGDSDRDGDKIQYIENSLNVGGVTPVNTDITDPAILGGGNSDRDGDKVIIVTDKLDIHGKPIIGGGDSDRDGDKPLKPTKSSAAGQ